MFGRSSALSQKWHIVASLMLAFFVLPSFASAEPIELPGAIHSIRVGGRSVNAGDAVFRQELAPLNGSTDNFWGFNFEWPNFVQNHLALIVVFRGTFGNLDGGAPVDGVNYGLNLQQWAGGNNDFGKFINLPPLKDAGTTASTYTVMIAERDPDHTAESIDQQVLWFSSGGTQGIAPLKYSLLTFEFKGDEFIPVIVVPGILGSAERHGQWVIDPITHTYDNLIDTLAANGYTRELNLFTFPYDWRKSNVDTALLLRDKINSVQSICHCQKVDLVAHSMGGLVSRQYIQSDNYENDVGKMIFLGTPHLGAPVDYFMWEAGLVGKDSDPQSVILKLFLTTEAIENGHSTLFRYIRDKPVPSIRELLPVYSYLFNEDNSLRLYPNNYPTNPFLENLKASVNSLFLSGVEVSNIAGNNNLSNTLVSIDVKPSSLLPLWPDGMPVGLLQPTMPLGTHFGAGDRTVPFVSASSQFPDTLVSNAGHSVLPTQEEGTVYNILTSKQPVTLINKSLIRRVLAIFIHSPADLTIIAPDGKKVGRSDGQEINEVSGAFYSGFDTNTEFIVIPEPIDGEYKVSVLGTDAGGAYTIVTNYITEEASFQKEIVGSIAPDQIIDSTFALDASNVEPIVLPNSDVEAPLITINSPIGKDYLHSDIVPIDVIVTDVSAGVASSTQFFDSVATSTNNLDLFFQTLGVHTLSVTASDFAGNATTSSVKLNIVTTPESTILDVRRVHSLGWITKVNVRDSIIQKINNAIRLEKRIVFLEERLSGRPRLIKRIEKLEARIDKILGRLVLKELDTHLRKKNITQQGYNIIKADIQWLLNQQ